MTDTIPLMFLDVDGVLNAICYATPDGYLEGRARPGDDERSFPIKWHPMLIKAINWLHESNLVEIKWLTTWGSSANGELRELLGLPEFEVAHDPTREDLHRYHGWDWWKFEVVRRAYRENPERKLIWVDDDINIEHAARQWAIDHGVMAISPVPHVGLSVSDAHRIRTLVSNTVPVEEF